MSDPADPSLCPSLSPRRRGVLVAMAALLSQPALVTTARAETPVFKLSIRDQKFEPAELVVPVDQKIELHVTNAGTAAVEFESSDLRREKVIAPGQTAILYLGPLRAGTYKFFDDFRPSTRGQLIAR